MHIIWYSFVTIKLIVLTCIIPLLYSYQHCFVVLITGASYIKTILIETSKLHYLHVGKNLIGNDGIGHITKGLKNNKTLKELLAYDCGFQ